MLQLVHNSTRLHNFYQTKAALHTSQQLCKSLQQSKITENLITSPALYTTLQHVDNCLTTPYKHFYRNIEECNQKQTSQHFTTLQKCTKHYKTLQRIKHKSVTNSTNTTTL